MIIECKNCLKKFTVRDSDIPINGRTVQCGSCSTQWVQMPVTQSVKSEGFIDIDKNKIDKIDTYNNIKQNTSKKKIKASDGKDYQFLGSQWAEVLPSGKSGRLARKNISKELNKLTGRVEIKSKPIKKTNQSVNQYQEIEGGMGIFSFLIVFIVFACAVILALDTFKNQLIPFFPSLDNYLIYIFETLNNIYIITKDLINNYK